MVHASFTVGLDVFAMVDLIDMKNPEISIDRVISLIMTVYASIIICCVGGLSCYHSRLACAGATTNEELRGKYVGGNPYDKGCKKNCSEFCYGGTSRVLSEGYNEEIASTIEPNIFLVRPAT
jgi:hypothetical protein